MCTKNITFRPSNVSTYVLNRDKGSFLMKSQIYAQKYEPHLIFKSVRKITVLPEHERQPLVLPKYVPCLGQDQVVRTSTGEKKGERLMAFTRPPPSQTPRRRAEPPCRASLTFTSSKIPGLYEKIWTRFLLQISQIGTRDIHIECSKQFK
jgi:hypothetical protein